MTAKTAYKIFSLSEEMGSRHCISLWIVQRHGCYFYGCSNELHVFFFKLRHNCWSQKKGGGGAEESRTPL